MTDDIDFKDMPSIDVEQLKDAEKQSVMVVESPDKPAGTKSKKDKSGRGDTWIGGLVLITVGLIMLVTTMTDYTLNNWWALFILIPAFGSLGHAVSVYRTQGRLGSEGRGSIMGALVMFFVAAAFLFNMNWGTIWPYFLIVPGIGLLISAFLD